MIEKRAGLRQELLRTAVDQHVLWWAAALQTGGRFTLDQHKKSLIRITDKDYDSLERLYVTFGGYLHRATHSSYTLEFNRDEALYIAEAISSCAPGLQHLISDFRTQTNKGSSEAGRFLKIPSKMYNDLLKKGEFVAGVIDMRGVFTTHKKGERPRLAIASKNVPLLEEMFWIYHGSWHQGENNAVLTFFYKDLAPLLHIAYPHMILKKKEVEKWDRFGLLSS